MVSCSPPMGRPAWHGRAGSVVPTAATAVWEALPVSLSEPDGPSQDICQFRVQSCFKMICRISLCEPLDLLSPYVHFHCIYPRHCSCLIIGHFDWLVVLSHYIRPIISTAGDEPPPKSRLPCADGVPSIKNVLINMSFHFLEVPGCFLCDSSCFGVWTCCFLAKIKVPFSRDILRNSPPLLDRSCKQRV